MATATLESPTDLLHFQLCTALTMEDDSLAALGELEKAARSDEVKEMFKHHADETREQIENLHKIFQLLQVEESAAPSPTTKGINKQAEALIEKSAPKLHDQVVLECALGNEHYEISAYESLIIAADSMGAREVVDLLKANLDQESHTSKELKSMLEKLAA